MKRILFLGGFLLAMTAPVAFVGCEEDEDGVTGGAVDTAKFEAMAELFGEGLFSFDEGLLDISFELIDSIPLPPTASPHRFPVASSQIDSLSWSYEYSDLDFWHIFTCYAVIVDANSDDADTFRLEGIDSLRFSDSAGHMRYPDSTTETLEIHCHIAAEISASEGTVVNVGSHADLSLVGEYEGDFTINGETVDTMAVFIAAEPDTCTIQANMNQTFTDLVADSLFREGESCPPSGSIVVNLGLAVECSSSGEAYDSLDIEGNWQISFVFSNRFLTATYNDGAGSWSYTGYCGPDVTASPLWRGLAAYVREYR